ncbi:MAG: oligosaccharide flippase family protein [Ferruginibacter sp.]|nr:oligosaccharide flippase family protein [Ferruginibacter sp.]
MQFTKALQHNIGWKALNTVLAFFINLLLVRILGAAESGDFFYTIALLSFFTLVTSWSMEAGITFYGSKHRDSVPAISLLILPWLVMQAVVVWVLLHFMIFSVNRQISWLYVLSNLVIIYFSALYYAKKWFISINVIVCVVNSIVLVSLLWIFSNYGSDQEKLANLLQEKISWRLPVLINNNRQSGVLQDFNFAGIAYFAGFLLQALALSIFFFFKSGFTINTISFNTQMARNIFRYSSIAFISNILFFLVTRIDYYFVQKYCSEIDLSNYVQVSKMGQLLVLLPSMMAGVIFPFSSGADDRDYLFKVQFLCRLIGLVFIPVASTVIITGYWLFPWLFGSGFTGMYPSMLLYLPGFYCLSLVTVLAAHLAGRAMLTKNMIASAIALVIVISGDILLVPLGGIFAAAAVSSIAYFLCLVYLLGVFRNHMGCNPYVFFAAGKTDIKLLLSRLRK